MGADVRLCALDGVAPFAHPPMLAGEPADPADPAQVMVNATLATQQGVRVGDVVEVAPMTWQQFNEEEGIPTAPRAQGVRARVTGILETPDDLSASAGSTAVHVVESALFLGRGWAQTVGSGDFARYGTGIAMHLRPGGDAHAILEAAAPGQEATVTASLWDLGAFGDAVEYEARAAYAATALAAVAVVAFVVQLVGRQALRELDDAEPLRALGATRWWVVQSVAPRWAISALLAAAVATGLSAALRPLGPIGLGRRLIGHPAVSVDPLVAGPAVVLLAVLVLVAGLAATWLAAHPAPATPGRARRLPAATAGSPTAMAGFAIGYRSGQRRRAASTVAAVAVAVATAVASATVLASMGRLTSQNEHFGATWDATAAAVLGPEAIQRVVRAVAATPGVEAAAGLIGNDATIGNEELYAYAFEPLEGLPEGVGPVVSRGRPPGAPGEVALGALTMERAGVDLGDTVALTYLDRTSELEVVGEAIINDGYEELPGVGAIVHHEWLRQIDRQAWPSDVLVRFAPGAAAAGVRALEQALPDSVAGPIVPGAIRNLQRIDGWLAVLTGLAVALAAVSFLHALVVTTRRDRRQLGVLRALGFSRRQVRASVAWYASQLAALAVVAGVPLGAALGRWGWSRFAHNLGVPPVPVAPVLAVSLVAVAALVMANLIALPVSWRAARGRPSDVLRAE